MRIEKWFLKESEYTAFGNKLRSRRSYFEINDKFNWVIDGTPPLIHFGEIVFTNKRDYFRFTFVQNTIVSVLLKKVDNETIVELIHEGFNSVPENKHELQFYWSSTWTFYLTNLKSVLENGIDLRCQNLQNPCKVKPNYLIKDPFSINLINFKF